MCARVMLQVQLHAKERERKDTTGNDYKNTEIKCIYDKSPEL